MYRLNWKKSSRKYTAIIGSALKILMKSFQLFGLLALLVGLLCLIPQTRLFPSLGVMHINNMVQAKNALTVTEGIDVNMPAGNVAEGQTWYPLVMTFDASSYFSKYIGRPLDLTILYNFGAYDPEKGYSRIFDTDSPYTGAFYGAYLIKEKEAFDYMFDTSGDIRDEALASVARFDYTRLVLNQLGAGLSDIKFEVIKNEHSTETLDGFTGYEVISSEVLTNSPVHRYESFKLGYLQYGPPPETKEEDFTEMTLYTRAWVRRIDEKNTTLVLYAMTPDPAFLEDMSEFLIHETSIRLY